MLLGKYFLLILFSVYLIANCLFVSQCCFIIMFAVVYRKINVLSVIYNQIVVELFTNKINNQRYFLVKFPLISLVQTL